MPEKHHRYGGSTIDRTLNCAIWRKLSDAMPKPPSSEAADTGTLLHNCMEECYTSETTFDEMLAVGREYQGITLTQTHVTKKLEPAFSATEAALDAYDIVNLSLEPFVELINDLAGGSIDLLGVSTDGSTIMILDYKFGYHVIQPDAPQLMFYALCALSDKTTKDLFNKVERIVCVIIQPDTVDSSKTEYKSQEYTLDDLYDFEDRVYDAIENAEASTTVATDGGHAGAWCKYCPAEPVCPVKNGMALQAQLLNIDQKSDLEKALPLADILESWIKSVRKLAHEQLERGLNVADYKIVNKRASRVWSDEKAVEKLVAKKKKLTKVNAYVNKLKSPAQMEILAKELGVSFELFTPLISSVSSGTTLVHESDRRQPAIAGLALKSLADRL